MPEPDNTFPDYLGNCQQRVNQALDACLPPIAAPAEKLKSAMRYSVQNGGKRLRATLLYASAEAAGCCSKDNCPNQSALNSAACAIELIHAYSLVHDDLPAMDDDDLRRGQATCHIAYDEATAILAGDALQTLAFECLAQVALPADTRLALILTLAQATGYAGMVGGQILDLDGENRRLALSELEQVHRYKTGALISASVRMGALIAKASPGQLEQLDQYAASIGLAFQIVDDILDIEGDTATLGKKSGADQALHKSTYPALLGMVEAKQKAKDLHAAALHCLQDFGTGADPLRHLASFVVGRKS